MILNNFPVLKRCLLRALALQFNSTAV